MNFRGHRSNFQCSHCDVQLCVRTYSRTRRSCWDIWHSTKRLEYRKPDGVARLPSSNRNSVDSIRLRTQEEISKIPHSVSLGRCEVGEKGVMYARNDYELEEGSLCCKTSADEVLYVRYTVHWSILGRFRGSDDPNFEA